MAKKLVLKVPKNKFKLLHCSEVLRPSKFQNDYLCVPSTDKRYFEHDTPVAVYKYVKTIIAPTKVAKRG